MTQYTSIAEQIQAPPFAGDDYRLLVTKLAAPRLRPDIVGRGRLWRLLDTGSERKLTLISTPPGYGKSTVASQWLAAAPHPGGWLSLDESDNDPVAFYRYLISAIRTVDNGLCEETARLTKTRIPTPVTTIVASLVNELAMATRPFTIVLDDYHEIVSPEIHEGMALLLRNTPPMFRLLMTTRTDPPFPLMRMRAGGELMELRASDLCFTTEETRELFCDRHGIDLTMSQIQILHSRTEGWPVGLMLVGQAMQGQHPPKFEEIVAQAAGANGFVDDYLWAESLEHLSPARRLFVLQTSILNQFNAESCDAVTQTSGAAVTLKGLEEDNLFIVALQGNGRWYRYHHLFAEFLRNALVRELPRESILSLHRRAAHFYANAEMIEAAARHAIQGEDWELALAILGPLSADLYSRERTSAVRSWLQKLPLDVLARAPDLCHRLGWSLARSGLIAQAKEMLELAERIWQETGNKSGMGKALEIRILEDLIHQNAEQGLQRCDQALELLAEEDTDGRARVYVMAGYMHLNRGALLTGEQDLMRASTFMRQVGNRSMQLAERCGYGTSLMMRAKLNEAATILRRVIATGDEWNDMPVQNAHSLLGAIYLEWNQLGAAEELLTRGIELADRMAAPLHHVRIHRDLAQVAWARRNTDTAFAEIDEVIDFSAKVGAQPDARIGPALLAGFWIASGQLELARGWASGTGLDPDVEPEYPRFPEYLTLLRLKSLQGENERVIAALEPTLRRAEMAGRYDDLLKLLVLKAIAEFETNDSESSAAAIESALHIGAPEGYVHSFLVEGSRLTRPLELAIRKGGEHQRYARSLLEILRGAVAGAGARENAALSPISTRETEILKMVSMGLSNRDIADQLFIAEQTVKKHLSNMFTKLEVSSRTQAVERGRRSGIL